MMLLENMMEIDGIPVKIEGERNLLEVISKTASRFLLPFRPFNLRCLPYVYG